ncbi:unnamed protein product [Arabidopsis thaliana]|uniref:Uncharacterized protein n=1 Tax=Arabidopsis thaliana TaxID=3702 RepID=A0A654FCS4_ARATH|nr:unnamed protein product [Arabidopsis thaliana]
MAFKFFPLLYSNQVRIRRQRLDSSLIDHKEFLENAFTTVYILSRFFTFGVKKPDERLMSMFPPKHEPLIPNGNDCFMVLQHLSFPSIFHSLAFFRNILQNL